MSMISWQQILRMVLQKRTICASNETCIQVKRDMYIHDVYDHLATDLANGITQETCIIIYGYVNRELCIRIYMYIYLYIYIYTYIYTHIYI